MYQLTYHSNDDTMGMSMPKPKGGEQTGQQTEMVTAKTGEAGTSDATNIIFPKAEAGTYEEYEKILKNPTVAEVRGIVLWSVITNKWNFEIKQAKDSDGKTLDPTPEMEEQLELIQNTFAPNLPVFISDATRSLDYGWAPFEKVYKMVGKWLTYDYLKPLDPKITELLEDASGKIVGIRNKPAGKGKDKKPVDLLWDKAWVYTWDKKFGNRYGNPRTENVRQTVANWDEVTKRLAEYLTKVAAIIVQLHYPLEGQSYNAGSAVRPNQWIAQEILNKIKKGHSIAFGNKYAAMTDGDPEKAAALAGKSDWVLSALELSSSDHSKGILDVLAYWDKLIFRGWLRPERSGLEATKAGSRADSQSQSDIAVVDSEHIGEDLARCVSQELIDDLLVRNWGESSRGNIIAVPQPIADDSVGSIDKIIEAGLGSPTVGPQLAQKVDWDQMFDNRDIPTIEENRGPLELPDPVEMAAAIAKAKAPPAEQKPEPANGKSQNLSAWQERAKRHLVLAGRELPWEDER